MIVLASTDAAVQRRWSEGLPHNHAAVRQAASLAEVEGLLAGRHPDVLVLDLRLPELRRVAGIADLLRYSPGTRVLAMAEVPEDDEALSALRAGARGYANLYMDPRLLARAVEALRQGEVWVARRLVQRLIEAAAGVGPGIAAAGNASNAALDGLSARERQIALLIGDGASNRDIAGALDITERTVKAHLSTVFDKLGVRDRLQLALLVNGRLALNGASKRAG